VGPVEIARLEQRAGLIGAIIEHDGRPHSLSAIAVDRRDVWSPNTVVLEPFVERLDPRLAPAGLHQLPAAVIHHHRPHSRARADGIRVRRPKQSARFAATLNSPPETWISNERALRNGIIPGSSRWTSAPSDRKSSSHASFRTEKAGICAPEMMNDEIRMTNE